VQLALAFQDEIDDLTYRTPASFSSGDHIHAALDGRVRICDSSGNTDPIEDIHVHNVVSYVRDLVVPESVFCDQGVIHGDFLMRTLMDLLNAEFLGADIHHLGLPARDDPTMILPSERA
jgi:hypothetical protein